jgi:hypothetical protein
VERDGRVSLRVFVGIRDWRGVSLAALNAAVNTTVLGCPDGDDGLLLLPHAGGKYRNSHQYVSLHVVRLHLRIRICA